MKRKKRRWLNRERSQIITFAIILVAVGFIGGIERGNLPLGAGIILSALTVVLALIVYVLGGNKW